MADENTHALETLRVPDSYCVIAAAGDCTPAIGAERYRFDWTRMPEGDQFSEPIVQVAVPSAAPSRGKSIDVSR
jgi:hypothetical protein